MSRAVTYQVHEKENTFSRGVAFELIKIYGLSCLVSFFHSFRRQLLVLRGLAGHKRELGHPND